MLLFVLLKTRGAVQLMGVAVEVFTQQNFYRPILACWSKLVASRICNEETTLLTGITCITIRVLVLEDHSSSISIYKGSQTMSGLKRATSCVDKCNDLLTLA